MKRYRAWKCARGKHRWYGIVVLDPGQITFRCMHCGTQEERLA